MRFPGVARPPLMTTGMRRVEVIPWLPGIGFEVWLGSLTRRPSFTVRSRSPLRGPVWCQSGCTLPTQLRWPPSRGFGDR
jgi:hypothetical protein